jgi:hypothetical protein
MFQLSEETKWTLVVSPTAGAAGTTVINSAAIDTANWDGVMFAVPFGTIAAGALTSIRLQQDDAAAMSAPADLAGTGQTILDTNDDSGFLIDVRRPLKRYVRLVIARGTAAATVGGVWAIQYRPRLKGQSPGVPVERWASPPEGTP